MASIEEVNRIAEEGNGYLASERSMFLVRKMKKQQKYIEAAAFLLNLARILLNKDKVSSCVSAYRSLEILKEYKSQHSEAPFEVPQEIRQMLYDYIKRFQPNHDCPDLYFFFYEAIQLLGDEDLTIINKEAEIADKSNNFVTAQLIYIRIIRRLIQKNEDASQILDKLESVSWRWIESISDRECRIYTSQFILSRCVLAISASQQKGLELATIFLQNIIEHHQNGPEITQPLFTFTKYFLKAIQQNSPQSVSFLVNNYQPIINADSEIKKWIQENKKVHFPTNGQTNNTNNNNLDDGISRIGEMFQSLFGAPQNNAE